MASNAIFVGYKWACRLEATNNATAFPSGATYRAHVRENRASTSALATMTTADGGITRVDNTHIDLVLTAAQTAAINPGQCVIDLVRADVSPEIHQGFALLVPVVQPVTRT